MNYPAPTESTIQHAGLPKLTLALSALVVLVCFAGCDMGTYNKRLNDNTPAPAGRSEKKMDDAGSDAKTDTLESTEANVVDE